MISRPNKNFKPEKAIDGNNMKNSKKASASKACKRGEKGKLIQSVNMTDDMPSSRSLLSSSENSELKAYTNTLLGKLGKSLSLKDLALDLNNHCILLFDDRTVLNIDLDEEGEKLIVFAYIGEIPIDAREILFEKILESNFFWTGTNGGTLGLDRKSQSIVLAKSYDLPLKHAENFEENLASFVEIVEKWIIIIEKTTEEIISRSLKDDEMNERTGYNF